MFKVSHALTTAAITAGILFGVSMLVGTGSRALDPVWSEDAPLTPNERSFIEQARIVTPTLDIDQEKTIMVARSLCDQITKTDDQLKGPFIQAFSTDEYTVTRAEAAILAHKLRASGLCNG